jgi:hypothetical protein
MISEASVIQFDFIPRYGCRFERFYRDGKKRWQVACQFDVKIKLANNLSAMEKHDIEYRQFIRGGVWFRRGNNPWTADDKPNGNPSFRIPPYAGQPKVNGLPGAAISGTGLSLHWKEDGEVESGGTERYGYRDADEVNSSNEIDLWTPNMSAGETYHLRDTPSFSGEWGAGDSVEVWFEVYFQGFVVQVERDNVHGNPTPVKVLKKKSWSYFWPDQKLSQWLHARAV